MLGRNILLILAICLGNASSLSLPHFCCYITELQFIFNNPNSPSTSLPISLSPSSVQSAEEGGGKLEVGRELPQD